jgi:hypothetical protein
MPSTMHQLLTSFADAFYRWKYKSTYIIENNVLTLEQLLISANLI